MNNPSIQRIYSEIVSRGYRNAPTYSEVKRDVDAQKKFDPFGYRF